MSSNHFIIKSRIFWKLFAAITSVTCLSLLVVYFYLTPLLTRFLFNQIEQTLVEKATLVRNRIEILSLSKWNLKTVDALTDQIAEKIKARVTIIDETGRVVGESDLDELALEKMENHLKRPEIQDSLRKKYGTSTRYSTTLKTNMLYVCVKTSKGFARIAIPLTAIDQIVRRIKHSILISALVALALSSVAGFFLSHSATHTLKEISEVARQTAKGDFSRRLLSTRRDELGDLSKAINEMGISLEKQFTELKNEKNQLKTVLNGMVEGVLVTNEKGEIILINPALQSMLCLEPHCLGKTILEYLRNKSIHESIKGALQENQHKEQEITLQMGIDEKYLIVHAAPLRSDSECIGCVAVFYDITKIRKLENIRKEFVANVSHELKTPLTNIRGYAETLRNGAVNDQKVASSFVEKIERNATQLQNLVEDILGLSEIESGRIEMSTTEVLLQNFVEEIRTNFDHSLKLKQLSFENKIPNTLTISTNAESLEQIFSNLLDNAIKYTSSGGRITIEAEPKDGLCKITVADTGMGISENDLPRIFERFYRVDKARSREMGGTGLGLAIVKHLVQANGGKIWVTSKPGKGSLFSFVLLVQQNRQH